MQKNMGQYYAWKKRDYVGLLNAWNTTASQTTENMNLTLWFSAVEHEVPKLIEQAIILTQGYDVVVTNPPYMGGSGMSAKLSNFVKKYYPDSKSDLFAVFIEKCSQMVKKNGYQAMITQHAWMFLSSFEKLRGKLLHTDIVNMAHLGARAFEEIGGEVVQTTSFVIRKSYIEDYKGEYCRLIEPTTQQGKEDMFLSCENRYTADQSNFSKIPGSPVAYWISKNLIGDFVKGKPIDTLANVKQGMIPGNVDAFVRLWHEVNYCRIGFHHNKAVDIVDYGYKWFPYNKGGAFRRWYGNIEHLINMENNGHDIKYSGKNNNYRLREPELYFKEAITWSKICSGAFSMRYMPSGCLFDIAGCCAFSLSDNLNYVLGFTNSCINSRIMSLISPTLNYEVEHIKRIPILFDEQKKTFC